MDGDDNGDGDGVDNVDVVGDEEVDDDRTKASDDGICCDDDESGRNGDGYKVEH